MKTVLKVLSVASAALCIGCVGIQAATSVGDAQIDITREFNYASQEEADTNPLPTEIEENGNTYVLDVDSVDYQQREMNTRYEETVTFDDLTSKDVPESYKVTLGDQEYDLPLEDVTYTETKAATSTMTVDYKGYEEQPKVPDTKIFTLEDGTEAEGTLVGVTQTEDDTWVDFSIDGQVTIPAGATQYVYLGSIHTYDPAAPLWSGYQSDLMASIGLSSASYKITGGKWTSDPIARAEGGFIRKVSFYGQKSTGKSYVATYEVTEPVEILYTAHATYAMSLLEVGLDESFGNASEYTICAIAHYVLKEVAEANPITGAAYRNRYLMPLLAAGFGIAGVACGFAGFSKSKDDEDVAPEEIESDEV